MTVTTAVAWPALTAWPRARVEVALARRLFERAVRMVPVQARYPDGRGLRGSHAPAEAPVFEVVRPAAFYGRLGRDTRIGFGEAYVAGDWQPGAGTDLADLLTPFAERLTTLVPAPLQRLRALVDERVPSHHDNTVTGSRDNVRAHYDLSNELFAAFLDESMTYSSAWFADVAGARFEDLHAAQLRKIDAVLDDAAVGAGTRLLEIGTGWGALAIRAAQRGAAVTSVTLSAEQLELARSRAAAAGVEVDLRLQDYREVNGSYDAVVSVEMVEAVGEKYWPTYFSAIDRLLAPGGRAAIQAITMGHDRMRVTRHSFGWIQKYIFPGGLIPSLQAIDETLAAHTALSVTNRRALGPHYARTLRLWRERFDAAWPQISRLGFDDAFRRTWEFYLAYCEAGFRVGYLDVHQLRLARRGAWGRSASGTAVGDPGRVDAPQSTLHTRAWRVVHHAVPGVDPDMMRRVAEEHQVTGLRGADPGDRPLLLGGGARQVDAGLAEDVRREAGAVEPGRCRAAVHVPDAQQALRDRQDAAPSRGDVTARGGAGSGAGPTG